MHRPPDFVGSVRSPVAGEALQRAVGPQRAADDGHLGVEGEKAEGEWVWTNGSDFSYSFWKRW